MYESFFEFSGRPFLASPLAERYYCTAAAEHAREMITRCLDAGQGMAVILGSAGTGKSTLCQVLAQQLRAKFQVAMLASARLCTRRALLQNILFELKLPYRDREEGELRLSLIDHLEPSERCPNGMLLIVDEAHMLPSRLLEEIRLLTNLVRDSRPRVRVVMAASLLLDERLASPRLESLNQRVAARCYLQSMTRDETAGYIAAQIGAVGGRVERVFTPDALHAAYRATDGVPRLVNQLCDHVLVLAAIGRRAPINAVGIEEAWADLQQLPSPWNCHEPVVDSGGSGAVLEFGELDDDFPESLGADAVAGKDRSLADRASEQEITARIERIEAGIETIARDDGAMESAASEALEDQFLPVPDRQPEIELVFHYAHDPFSERFEEEEVIVDPFASLESLGGTPEPQRPLERSASTIPFRTSEQGGGATGRGKGVEPPVQSVSERGRSTPRESGPGLADPLVPLPGDDRDLLEIQDELSPAGAMRTVNIPMVPPRRREYRQLFAKLRGK